MGHRHYRTPKVGDMAWHHSGLDPRRVVDVVMLDGVRHIKIELLGTVSSPMLATNYTYTREA
jgi:hypothetical protein